ncbi:hypothetical protein [Methanosarcina sp. UBA5]|uniref:hypothetical protein n=1 Tax=Methanosarcina sp. UBA5 TaxID=1915593 RepID=UPI0026012FA8|nr:hypothetical protein [Methanosarcina sp. UBA5]
MNKYGKLLLSAYIMKKMKSGRSPGRKGILRKYAKLALGAYLLNKLRSGRLEKEVEAELEPEEMMLSEEEVETGKGRPSMRIGKIILGGLAGATLIYAVKRRAAKKRGHKIDVE